MVTCTAQDDLLASVLQNPTVAFTVAAICVSTAFGMGFRATLEFSVADVGLSH